MTLSDRDIQKIQVHTKKYIQKEEGFVFNVSSDENPEFYQIIHRQDSVTQAMAVVPVDNEAGDNPNYQETTIVVAGTQVPFEHLKHWDDQAYFWKKDFDITASTANAFVASGWFGTVQGD